MSNSSVTGMRIIRTIVEGERNPDVLAEMRDRRCHSSAETICAALSGNWRDEHIFARCQAPALYDCYQTKSWSVTESRKLRSGTLPPIRITTLAIFPSSRSERSRQVRVIVHIVGIGRASIKIGMATWPILSSA